MFKFVGLFKSSQEGYLKNVQVSSKCSSLRLTRSNFILFLQFPNQKNMNRLKYFRYQFNSFDISRLLSNTMLNVHCLI